jgi:hypothetical protein
LNDSGNKAGKLRKVHINLQSATCQQSAICNLQSAIKKALPAFVPAGLWESAFCVILLLALQHPRRRPPARRGGMVMARVVVKLPLHCSSE